MIKILASMILSVLFAITAISQSQLVAPKVLATIDGIPVTEAQVRATATVELDSIESKKMQAEASFTRDQQNIYEQALAAFVDKQVVELEAKQRGVSIEALVADEMSRLVKNPTEEDVAQFWEKNKSQAGPDPVAAIQQVRSYLNQQARVSAYRGFLNRLRDKYKVQTFLDPLRISVSTEGFPSRGGKDAVVTIVEFADFQCPYCAQAFPVTEQLIQNYGSQVRFIYRHFPLSNIHPYAQKAAEAALCARDQDKFWEMYEALYKNNRDIGMSGLKQRASVLGLENEKFGSCLDSGKYSQAVADDLKEGTKAGVVSTPTFFINGRYFAGTLPYPEMAKVIEEELEKAKTRQR